MQKHHSDEVPWNIQETFVGILLTLIPWAVLSFILSSFGSSGPRTAYPPQVDFVNALISFLFSSLIEGAFLVAPFYFAYRASSKPSRLAALLDTLGFRPFPVLRSLLLIGLLFLVILGINILYSYLITAFHLKLQTNDQRVLQLGRTAPITTYFVLIASVLLAPFCEEVFFRSFIWTGFKQAMPLGLAIVLSALVFAVAHGDIGSFAVLFVIGLALAFLRWYTGSIWPGILLHLLNNSLGAILIIQAMHL